MKSPIEKANKASKKDIVFYGKDIKDKKIENLSSGILPLDLAIGIGGYPKGRIIEIHGKESSGKSSICLTSIAHSQQKGIKCAYVDAEFSFDFAHAQALGVNTNELIIVQPDTGEEALTAIESLIEDDIGMIVVDSVSGLVPQALVEAEFGKPPMGMQARMISQGLAKLVSKIYKHKTVLIFINQLRQNIMGGTFEPHTTPGGLAMKHYSSIRLDIRRTSSFSIGNEITGFKVRITVRKNKVSTPGKIIEIPYRFKTGFDKEGDIMEMAIEKDIVERKGSSYFYNGEKLAVGKDNSREVILSKPNLKNRILETLFPDSEPQH